MSFFRLSSPELNNFYSPQNGRNT